MLENERVMKEQRDHNMVKLSRWSRNLKYSQWIQRGQHMVPVIEQRFKNKNTNALLQIWDLVGMDYCISGSWVAKEVADIVNLLLAESRTNNDEFDDEELVLVSNDIDVYYGLQSDRGLMEIVLPSCAYHDVVGIPLQVNTIQCCNLSSQKLLDGNDINVTEASLSVQKNVVGDDVAVEILIGGSFWELLLQPHDVRRLAPCRSDRELEAKTYVRLAFKSFELGIDVDWDKYRCKAGEIAESHVKKLKSMEGWEHSPLQTMVIQRKKTKTLLSAIASFTPFSRPGCRERGNKRCAFTLCKTCCKKRIDHIVCKAHN